MHILIVALHRPIKPTGVCRHAVNLANCLAEKPEITKISLIIGIWQQEYFAKAFTFYSEKIQLITVNFNNSSLTRNKWFLWELPQLANSLNPDIVHFAFPLPFFRAKFNSPVVTTIHDLYPYECPENFGFPQVLFNRWFLKQCISNSDGIACVSQSTLESLKHYFPALDSSKTISVIYNYVDFSHVKPQIPERFALKTNESFLLCVAQHRQNKNLDLLIKSYAQLLKNGNLTPSIKLLLVGNSGPETDNLYALIQTLNLQSQVVFLSSLKDEELCWLYKKCQIFIIPSSTEGFCLPLVEALTLAPQVICSDIPIFREVGGNNCTYFSLENNALTNLSQAIVKFLERPNIANNTYITRFNKSHIAQQYLDLYSQVNPLINP